MRVAFWALLGAITIAAGSLLINPTVAAATCKTAGLDLPPGFCATVFKTDAGAPRHLAVAANGTVYVNLAHDIDGHSLMALRDTNGDGVADETRTFGHGGGTGIVTHDGWLYAATVTDIYRYQLGASLLPVSPPSHVVSALPQQNEHSARGLAIGDHGALFVSIGAPSNSCQKADRVSGSPGQDPCPLLKRHGGIWRFLATRGGQRFSAAARYATGLRNMFAIAYNTPQHQLYGVQMGRDQLHSDWPGRFTEHQSAHLPAEQMVAVDRGDNFGWPYCYYDPHQHEKLLNPEYGGDGHKVGRCGRYQKPIAAFPAHWAPMALVFYTGAMFPRHYHHGAFIAFHGSWNRVPYPQAGYRVIFHPFAGHGPEGHYTTFAGPQGFTGKKIVRSPGEAAHRPAGLAIGPQGALYISDDAGGTIYRVTYTSTSAKSP